MLDIKQLKDDDGQPYAETSISGKALLFTPQLNKGTAFNQQERHDFGLTGKLPTHIENLDKQLKRAYKEYSGYDTPLQKHAFLTQLHNSNQVLFFKLVSENLAEMIPIIYTPTVGDAVIEFSHKFVQSRGIYISYEHIDVIDEILENRSNPNIDVIVASDGGGVLGIGDQGAGAMLIPVAKLAVYTLFGGIDPFHTLPIMLDVGTDNQSLLDDPLYLGWRHSRISGKQYNEFIDKFVAAKQRKLPKAFLHWEDFGRDNAARTLHRYRDKICTFNDDIQGTGAVTLAALLSGIKANKGKLLDQQFVIFGGGTAGTGITEQIFECLILNGLSKEEARKRFWMLDRPGLLLDSMDNLTPEQTPYARTANDVADWAVDNPSHINLLEVIKNVKPTILIGCSTVHGAFNQQIVEEMSKHIERPIIFPLSNPTSLAEALPEDLLKWTDGKALIATGSPFEPVEFKGKTIPIGQCNNALVFPGIGLGVVSVRANRVTDNMLWAACQELSHCAPINDDPMGPLLPTIDQAHIAAKKIALAVAIQAQKDGVTDMAHQSEEDIEQLISERIWEPKYVPLRRV